MNEPGEDSEMGLQSTDTKKETAKGSSDRMMPRIAHEARETARVESLLRRWKLTVAMVTACGAVLAGIAYYCPWRQDHETQPAKTDPRSDSELDVETAESSGLIILELPASGEAEKKIAKADWLPKDFVLFIGTLDNPQGSGGGKTIELKADRVIKGNTGSGRIIARDELFSCQGPESASSIYPLRKPLLCWLTHEKGKWNLVELEPLTPELQHLLNAVTGGKQAELLRPLITPHGLDFRTTEVIKLVASPEQVSPLLKELVRETPPLLEPFKGASGPSYDTDWQQRMKLVSYRLSPALDILCRFSEYKDTELVDLILPCYPPLRDPGGDGFRFYLSDYLKDICRAAQQEGGVRLSERQIAKVRELLLAEIEGARDKKSSAANAACEALGFLSDSDTVTALLKKQDERPIHAFHESIAGALFQINLGRHALAEDDMRIRLAWIETLNSFDNPDQSFENEAAETLTRSFANYVAGSLYQSDISVTELRALREFHQQTPVPWLRDVVARFARKPVPAATNADSESKASVSVNEGTLITEFSNDAPADPATIKKLKEWDGPTTVRLNRSSRASEILALLDESELDRLELAFVPLSHDVLVAIGDLRSLRSVSIYHGAPCDLREFRELCKLRTLESLEIIATPLVNDDGEGITALGSLSSLRKLSLSSVGPLTDWHLGRIHYIDLEDFRIDSQDVTSDGIEELATTMPKLKTIALPQVLIRKSLLNALQRRNVKIYPPLVEGSTRVWRTNNGQQIYAGQMTDRLHFITGGSILAADEGTSVRFYDMQSGGLVRTIDEMLNVERCYSADSKLLARRDRKQIIVEDFSGKRSMLEPFDADDRGMPFEFLPGGESIAVSDGNSIRILDVTSGVLRMELRTGGYFSPDQIRVSSDGKWLASTSSGAGLRIWSLADGKEQHSYPDDFVLFGFSNNGRTLLCMEKQQSLIAIGTATGEAKSVLEFPENSQPLFSSVSWNHFAFASQAMPIVVDLYDTTSWKRLQQFRFNNAESHFISSVALTPDGNVIAVSGNQNYRGVD